MSALTADYLCPICGDLKDDRAFPTCKAVRCVEQWRSTHAAAVHAADETVKAIQPSETLTYERVITATYPHAYIYRYDLKTAPPADDVVTNSSDLQIVLKYLQTQWLPRPVHDAMQRLEQRGHAAPTGRADQSPQPVVPETIPDLRSGLVDSRSPEIKTIKEVVENTRDKSNAVMR